MGLWSNFLNAWDGSSTDLQDMRTKLLDAYISSIQWGNSRIEIGRASCRERV